MNAGPGFRGAWVFFLAASVLLISCTDAVLIEISQTFFTAGFNRVYIEGAGMFGAFALTSLLVDLCLVVGLWSILLPWAGRRGGTSLQKLVGLSLASIAVPLGVDFLRYQVGLLLGRTVSFPILWEVSGGAAALWLEEVAAQGGFLALVLLLAGVVSAALIGFTGKVQASCGFGGAASLPDARRFRLSFAVLLVVSSLMLIATPQFFPRIHAGLVAKPSALLLTRVIQFATDLDRDGAGLLSHPADAAPFDGTRHPFAIDLPGNGIDENGFAGDLPVGWRVPESVAPGAVDSADTRRPDFLLIYLESFRADRLGATRNGREITPFLNQLARDGSSSQQAYVHSPYTIRSRSQLYSGRLSPRFGERTLVDDFKGLGYRVVHFSGQDDSFGRSDELLGLDRVDHFYDARADMELRSSRSTSAGGLQISSKLLTRRVGEYLADFDSSGPLFLYVNIVDTHFPYTHEELDDLLGVSPISRYEINVGNAEEVRSTFDNTSANVDLAIREVVERFRAAIGDRDHAIMVAADHGQALFEKDFLGHGQALTSDQTRTPFVLWGVGGDWPEPLGMSDVRGLLQRNLFKLRGPEVPRARFVPDPERRLFQFMARLRKPHLIGLRSLAGLANFSFGSGALEFYDASDSLRRLPAARESEAFEELIHTWEVIQASEAGDAADRDGAEGPA